MLLLCKYSRNVRTGAGPATDSTMSGKILTIRIRVDISPKSVRVHLPDMSVFNEYTLTSIYAHDNLIHRQISM